MDSGSNKKIFKVNNASSQGGTAAETRGEEQREFTNSKSADSEQGFDFNKIEWAIEKINFSNVKQDFDQIYLANEQDKFEDLNMAIDTSQGAQPSFEEMEKSFMPSFPQSFEDSEFSTAFKPQFSEGYDKTSYCKSKTDKFDLAEVNPALLNEIEGKTKKSSTSSKIWASICCVLMLMVVVGTPLGYDTIKKFFDKNKLDVVLPPQIAEACAVRHTSVLPDLAIPLDTRVEQQRLSDHMETLVNGIGNRFVDTRGNTEAKNYIVDKLAELGFLTESGTLWTEPFEIDVEASRQVKRKKKPNSSTNNPTQPEKPSNNQNHDSVEGEIDSTGATKPDPDSDADKDKEDDYEIVTEIYHIYYNSENVVAVKPTAMKNPKIVVVSAHIDTVYNTRGAIDNGSGVAALLEIARVVSETRRDYGVEVRFCFFSGEELGMHGAFKYLEKLTEEERSRHTAMINIDMAASTVSDIPKAFSVSTYGKNMPSGYVSGTFETPANNSVSAAAQAAFAKNNFDIPRLYAPIHWEKNDIRPFHRAGIDAATISWREIDKTRAITNYDIASPIVMHTPDDVLATMDMNTLNQTTRFAVETFEELCRSVRGETTNIIGEL